MTARLASNAAYVKSAALAVLPDLLGRWLPGGEWQGNVYVALNPKRDDRCLGSFRIDAQTGRWSDHAVGAGGGDAILLYAYLFAGGNHRAAFNAIANDPLVRSAMASGATAPPAKAAKLLKSPAAKLSLVRNLYARATEIAGMPAATYLQNRGLRPTDAWDCLRAATARYRGFGLCPILYAPISALDGSLVGLHRTYLTPAGAKLPVPNPRRCFGQVRGNAIRLGIASCELVICEGLEDGLTLYQECGVPVWVAGGASFLPLIALPDTIRSLTIAADNDAAGEKAAQLGADTFGVGGREVRIMRPAPRCKDVNDQLRGIKS